MSLEALEVLDWFNTNFPEEGSVSRSRPDLIDILQNVSSKEYILPNKLAEFLRNTIKADPEYIKNEWRISFDG